MDSLNISEKTVDPLVIGAQIVTAVQTFNSCNVNLVDQGGVTVVNLHAETGARSIIAETTLIGGTLSSTRNLR